MKPVISIKGVSKKYRLGGQPDAEYQTLRESVMHAAGAPVRMLRRMAGRGAGAAAAVPPPRGTNDLWALKDVSFDVRPGEVVGIVGRNGAGKSTLLKILSRITHPTEGRIEMRGRVGSLLEVGTGFHPELTGRENIYLNGAILGMGRREIARKFDDIVDFAEVERFLDTPVKRYSSGMYTRLAFAVASHLEPEILVVDEVLAVGDAAFQKKCLGRMGEVSREGRTVLFVSHNLVALQSLCKRAVWLDGGRLVADGESSKVVSAYIEQTFSAVDALVWEDPATAPGNDKVRIRKVAVGSLAPDGSDAISIRTPFALEFEYWNLEPGAHLNLSVIVAREDGQVVYNAAPIEEPNWHGRPYPEGLFRSRCFVPGDLLN